MENITPYNIYEWIALVASIKDTSFNIGTGFNEDVHPITLQPDGKILVGGFFTTFNDIKQNKIIRLNPDGTRDSL